MYRDGSIELQPIDDGAQDLESLAHQERRPLLNATSSRFPPSPGLDRNPMRSMPPPPDQHDQRFESLDYEEFENTVWRADMAARTTMSSILYSSMKWGICLAIGAVTAIAAFVVNLGVENISGFKFWATLTILQRSGYLSSFLLYASINATLVLASVCFTLFVGPEAAGSGIPQVKAYLNGVDVPGIFFFQTLAAKLIGAVGSVSGGLAIGKEGPFVHAGAAIAAILSQGGSSTRRLPFFRRMWNDRDRSDFVACGAAAGVAAAFRSPVGGVLFVLEELTSWWKNELIWFMFFTTAVVSVGMMMLMKACTENCGFFGSGGSIIFEIQQGQDNWEIYELLPVVMLGVVGGLLGASFVTLNARLAVWRKTTLSKYGIQGKVAEALVISLLTSVVSFCMPLMVKCLPCPSGATAPCPRVDNSHSGNFVSFGCTRGWSEYNDLATLFFNTQDDAIRNLFSSQTKAEYTVSSLITFVVCFYFLAVVTYGISCPVGLFVPGILCGAAYGRLVGIFVADIQRHKHIDEGTYALLGAASFLGGSMRLTMCMCVMLLELTNNLALLPLTMLVLLMAKFVGDGTGVKSIYEVLMDVKSMPYLSRQPEGFLRHVNVKECCSQPPVSFLRVEKVSNLVRVLKTCKHNSFPVKEGGGEMSRGHPSFVDVNQRTSGGGHPSMSRDSMRSRITTEEALEATMSMSLDSVDPLIPRPRISSLVTQQPRRIAGMVLRQHLLVLLEAKRAMQPSPVVSADSLPVATSFDFYGDFSKPISTDGLTIEELEGDLEPYMEMFLDLGPYVDPSYYVVQEDASLSKVYKLFRTLGLRHLCVIPRANQIVGIITREDLLSENVGARFEGGSYRTDGMTIAPNSPLLQRNPV